MYAYHGCHGYRACVTDVVVMVFAFGNCMPVEWFFVGLSVNLYLTNVSQIVLNNYIIRPYCNYIIMNMREARDCMPIA